MRASMHGEVADTRSKKKRQCMHTGYVHSRIDKHVIKAIFVAQTVHSIQLHYTLPVTFPQPGCR